MERLVIKIKYGNAHIDGSDDEDEETNGLGKHPGTWTSDARRNVMNEVM